MRRLPFADDSFTEVTHHWCLYHLDDPKRGVLVRAMKPDASADARSPLGEAT